MKKRKYYVTLSLNKSATYEFDHVYVQDFDGADAMAKMWFYGLVRHWVISESKSLNYGGWMLHIARSKNESLTCLDLPSTPKPEMRPIMSDGIWHSKDEFIWWEDGDYTRAIFECDECEFRLCSEETTDEIMLHNHHSFVESQRYI
ncbi:MAG: hypothetical protein ACRCVT_10135 [Leadbetterella sp.]